MGYMIQFDEEIVGAEELKLIETKKAILKKLQVRFGFQNDAKSEVLAPPTAASKGLTAARVEQPY